MLGGEVLRGFCAICPFYIFVLTCISEDLLVPFYPEIILL